MAERLLTQTFICAQGEAGLPGAPGSPGQKGEQGKQVRCTAPNPAGTQWLVETCLLTRVHLTSGPGQNWMD